MKNNIIFIFIIGIMLSLGSIGLFSAETLVTIVSNGNINYDKPEVKYAPNGAIYVAYQADNISTGRSDILLSKYENGKVSYIKNISNSSAYSYEPEMDIQSNGNIHIAWCDQSGSNHYIKYSYFNGSSWSNPQTFGAVYNKTFIQDLRLVVDNAGNAFVVFMYWPEAKSIFISKYGNNIDFQDFPQSGRTKHPDVAVDNNYVHVVSQYMNNGYSIAYDRRPNNRGSNWQGQIDVHRGDVQKPRMGLDSGGTPHVMFQDGEDPWRTVFYKYRSGNSFTGYKQLSSTAGAYHYMDINAANSSNILTTMKLGRAVYYNWKVNGIWSGYQILKKSAGQRPDKSSSDLNKHSLAGAVTFVSGNNQVSLVLLSSSGQIEPGAPIASFTATPTFGHTPLNVEFDGTSSYSDNGTIVSWAWNFGDGSFGSGQTTSHTYNTKGFFIITLTVTDNNGKTGTTSRIVEAIKVNTPPLAYFSFTPKSGLYPLFVTFDPEKSIDSDGHIVRYIWTFGDGSSVEKKNNSPFTHRYDNIGNFTIVLRVIDNENAMGTFYKTVFVFGVEPPQYVKSEILENRTLFTIDYVSKISWLQNDLNIERGVNIVKYKILRKRKEESSYTLIHEVPSTEKKEHIDRIGGVRIEYDYKVVAVDDGGRESN